MDVKNRIACEVPAEPVLPCAWNISWKENQSHVTNTGVRIWRDLNLRQSNGQNTPSKGTLYLLFLSVSVMRFYLYKLYKWHLIYNPKLRLKHWKVLGVVFKQKTPTFSNKKHPPSLKTLLVNKITTTCKGQVCLVHCGVIYFL